MSANLARKTTGFSEEDLELLWTAILNMFENDHSAARGKMAVRELIVFKHDCELGCAPAHKLFDLVKVAHKDGVTAPRSYGDYTVSVDEDAPARRRDLHADGVIYQDEDFLQLSGLQHFKFCRRQWALIHVEKQWAENCRTTDGAIMHENAHDGSFTESRGDLVITRDMRVFSRTLGVSGACDVLEFRRGETGIPLKGREGLWQPYPVEYKRGKPKEGTEDTLQLCGQAMCLEEMLCCEIPRGALYYGEPRRRTEVDFTPELRRGGACPP